MVNANKGTNQHLQALKMYIIHAISLIFLKNGLLIDINFRNKISKYLYCHAANIKFFKFLKFKINVVQEL